MLFLLLLMSGLCLPLEVVGVVVLGGGVFVSAFLGLFRGGLLV